MKRGEESQVWRSTRLGDDLEETVYGGIEYASRGNWPVSFKCLAACLLHKYNTQLGSKSQGKRVVNFC